MEYIVLATNQDVLLFKLLNFFGVLLTETCYYSRLYGSHTNIKGLGPAPCLEPAMAFMPPLLKTKQKNLCSTNGGLHTMLF